MQPTDKLIRKLLKANFHLPLNITDRLKIHLEGSLFKKMAELDDRFWYRQKIQ